MSNVSDIYTLWLKPWHLPAGKPISVTIEKAETRTIHPRPTEERTALVLSFVGKNRKLILNDGNANKMSDIGGEDFTAWRGLVVQLKRVQFTKDKETIHILPGVVSSTRPAAPESVLDVVEVPLGDNKPTALPAAPTDNGHTDTPTPKPYRFPSTAASKFFEKVQSVTDNHYKDGADLQQTLGGWFDFGNAELWNERLSYACDMARSHPEFIEGQPA